MSLEQVVSQVYDFFTQTPVKATLDIGGHALAGSFLVQRYFPEVPKSMKAALGLVGGFAPDFDFLTLGVLKHRGLTHTGGFAVTLASWMLYFNQEDWYKYKYSNKISKNAINDIKRIFTSRYAKLASLGVALHLGMDALDPDPEKLCYCVVMGGALALQNYVNRTQNRYVRKENFRMHPCIVADAEGKKYVVVEDSHSKCAEEFLAMEKRDAQRYNIPPTDLPEYKIPGYKFGDTDIVREHQKKVRPDVKTLFERIDERVAGFFRQMRRAEASEA